MIVENVPFFPVRNFTVDLPNACQSRVALKMRVSGCCHALFGFIHPAFARVNS